MYRRAALAVSATILLAAGCGGGGYDGGNGSGNSYNPPPAPPPMTPPPAAPTIALDAIVGGVANRTTTLSATVTAPAGVTRVEFLVDGTVVGTSTTAPYTATWDTSTVADGAHSLTARVTDASNAVVTSAPVSITVNNNPVIAVTLSPDETFPRPTSTATGSGELTFNLITGAVSGGVTVSGIAATLAHIHQGYAGASGPVIIDFAQSPADPNRWEPVAGAVLTAEQVNELMAGKLYVNVHSAAYPLGEIRGQLAPANIDVVFTAMSGDAVVPPVTIPASGVAATTVDSTASSATVHANTTGVDDATEAHVHKAAAGASNPTALLTLTKDSVAPGHWFVEAQPVTAVDLTDFTANGWYVDVHTPANPAGALRGQITPSVTLTQLQSTIFTPRCASCHTGGGSALPASMNLTSAAASFAALVNVPSTEQPAVLRVAPNNPDASYLVQKISGAPGITGSQMPLGGPFLDQATIDQVRAWITAGAANN